MRTHADHLRMEQAALEYADQRLYIVPLHAPLFNSAGECVGCTCEAYKRSQKYKVWLESKGRGHKFDPAFKCRTPGKHPRLSDWETEASKDPVQIRKWFARWPQLNVGIAAGRSGLLVMDADAYKENYAGADLISREDEQAPTNITQSGGQHLIFQKPEGKTYTNANNTLPEGVDIRCDGGMIVVYPSIGPSGRQYQWEDGYSLFEIEPPPLPKALEALLDAAQAKSKPAQAVKFTTPTTEPPDLSQWLVSSAIREQISEPAQVGQRSEADYSVCLSLVYAGATNEDILAVFEHNPIGTKGKFAEAGRGYLARTIGRARTFAEDNPRPDVPATIELLRLWIRTHTFEGYIPKSSNDIYYTDSTDTKVADAVFDAMLEDNRLEITIGKKRLGKLAGVGCNTALRALGRLNGFLFTVTPDKFGAHVALVEKCRLQHLDPSLTVISVLTGDPNAVNDKMTGVINEYSPRKADDAFLNGKSRHVKQQMRDTAAALDISDREALEQFTFKGFGETGLRIIDALLRVGDDMTILEMMEETGKKQSAIRTACGRLLQHGLMEATRDGSQGNKVYGLADDVWGRLEAVAPHLRTYKLSAQRENKRLESAQAWTKTEIAKAEAAGDTEQAVKLERRFAKQAKTRIGHLESLHPDLSAKEIERLAYEVAAYKRNPKTEAAVKAIRTEQLTEHRETIKLVADLIAETIDAGTTKEDVFATVCKYGFDEGLVRSVLSNQHPVEHAAMSVGVETLARNIAEYKAAGISKAVATQELQYAGFIPGEVSRAWDMVSA